MLLFCLVVIFMRRMIAFPKMQWSTPTNKMHLLNGMHVAHSCSPHLESLACPYLTITLPFMLFAPMIYLDYACISACNAPIHILLWIGMVADTPMPSLSWRCRCCWAGSKNKVSWDGEDTQELVWVIARTNITKRTSAEMLLPNNDAEKTTTHL